MYTIVIAAVIAVVVLSLLASGVQASSPSVILAALEDSADFQPATSTQPVTDALLAARVASSTHRYAATGFAHVVGSAAPQHTQAG